MTQLCFRGLKPSPPTIRTPRVARRIAERIVAAVNLDDFYWTREELPDRVADVAEEIQRCGRPATVIDRLYRKQPPINDRGERGGDPWGWEGISEHCCAIADEIAAEVLRDELEMYAKDFGGKPC